MGEQARSVIALHDHILPRRPQTDLAGLVELAGDVDNAALGGLHELDNPTSA